MKKTRLLASMLAVAMTLSTAVALAQEIPVTPAQVTSMSTPEVRMISGTFNDFFPDATLAQAVASQLRKQPTDIVTLWELQSITYLSIYSNVIDLENIGYLMNIDKLYIGDASNIIFHEDIKNCQKLKTLSLMGVSNTLDPIIADTSIELLEINSYGVHTNTPLKQWETLHISDAILDKMLAGKLRIEQRFTDLYAPSFIHEAGSPMNIQANLPNELNQLGPLQGPISEVSFSIAKLDKGNFVASVFSQQLTNQTYDELIKTMNAAIESISEPGEYGFGIGGNYNYGNVNSHSQITFDFITADFTIVKAPVIKDINKDATTFSGTPINIKGQLKGDFVEGQNVLDRAAIDAQNLAITANGTTYDATTILQLQVMVVNDVITTATIVGIANGEFYSVIV